MIDAVLQILRDTLRQVIGYPAFAVAVILTLALGVGATSAIFSVINGVMLKPLPYSEPEQLVRLGWQWGPQGEMSALSGIKFEHAREHGQAFSGLAIAQAQATRMEREAGRELEARGQRVSVDWLSVLGYQPVLGRDFEPAEDQPGGDRVVAISDRLWRALFDSDPTVIGQSLRLDGESHRVVAVLPPDYQFVDAPGWTDFLVPLRLHADPRDASHNFLAIGRLADGIDLQGARGELEALAGGLVRRYPQAEQRGDLSGGYQLADYRSVLVGSRLSRNLWLLLGAVGFVLLIVTSNVASLFLARVARRRPEIALRSALGAGRSRVMTQVLGESALLGLAGGLLGLLLGIWLVAVLLEVGPDLPRSDAIGMDWRVLSFTLAIGVLSALVSSLAAAWTGASTPLALSLREGGHSAGGSASAGRARGLLLTLQAALAVVLLAGAVTMIGTFNELRRVDLGFEPGQVVAVDFGRPPEQYASPPARTTFRQSLMEQAAALPGARSVAFSITLPFEQGLNLPVSLADDPASGEGAVEWRAVSGDYFETLGIERRSGRLLSDADRAGTAPVVVVSESFARRYFSAESPLGRQLNIGYLGREPALPGWEAEEPSREIVGVVADVRDIHPAEPPRRTVYVPLEQVPPMLNDFLPTLGGLLIDGGQRSDRLFPLLREITDRIRPALAHVQLRRLSELGGQSLGAERFNALLLGGFATLGLVLVAVGLYGALSFLIVQRTREIGVRLALGADPKRVMLEFMRRGLAWVVLGAALGLVLAGALAEVFEGLALELAAIRPDAIVSALAVLAVVSLLSAWFPARRAAAIQPMEALRHD